MVVAQFLSRTLTCGTILAMMDLLFMAAIANDGSVSSLAGNLNSSGSGSSENISLAVDTTATSPASTISPSPVYLSKHSFASLVRDNGSDEVEKIKGTTSYGAGNWTTGVAKLDAYEAPPENSSFLSGNRTLTAQVNSNALIPCLVKSSAEAVTVSWIRREIRNYHLLTVGLGTYSSDNRFQVIHAQSPEDWTLKIRYVQPRDAGVYECSISTHPPASIFVTLNVVEAHAEIPGGPDKYIKSGSTLRLICDFKMSTEQPEYVFWFQGFRMINYDPSRSIEVRHERYSSTLLLNNVQKSDSGNYTCNPSNASPASIFVHIINGENPAAMQHGSHSTTCVPCPPLWFLSILLSLTLQHLYFRFLNDCRHMERNFEFPTTKIHHHSSSFPLAYLRRYSTSR